MKYPVVTAFGAALFVGAASFAGSPAAPYDNTRVNARLNVAVKEDTDVVHFVRDNADPNVITKAYVVKNVDPYELRSYLRNIVQVRKIDTNNTNIEAVKYTDGTSILLISAEEYRFNDTPNAQGFDSIVKELDKPKLVSSSGRMTYVYSPRYRSSEELREMISEVGLYSKDVIMNNVGGTDVVAQDPGLNLLFFCTAPFSRRSIVELLKDYDKPTPSARAKVTVYELYAENDTKLGLDFQAWKNNDGINFFNAGGRFSRNYNGDFLAAGAKWNNTTYFQFNPKWNTKYIDFLTSKGKAKVVHTSEIDLLNNTTATLSKATQVFYANAIPVDNEDGFRRSYFVADDFPAGNTIGTDENGKSITISANESVTVLEQGKGNFSEYILRLPADSQSSFVIDGNAVGKKAVARRVSAYIRENLTELRVGHNHGNTIELKASREFGFRIDLTPSINTKATMLNVKVANSSLMGYTSDGTPRIQKGAEINTDFVISNEGTKLVIGGIEKKSVMSVSGGIPLLKDLPVIGWLFSTETEATKRSQLLVVAEIVPAKAADHRPALEEVKAKLGNAGESNTYGYRQFLIDANRK